MSSKEAAACANGAARVRTRRSRLSAPLIAVALATAALGFSAAPAFATSTETFSVVASGGSTTPGCPSTAPCTLNSALSQAASGTYSGDNVVIDLGAGTYTESDYQIAGGFLNRLTLQSQSDSPTNAVLFGNATDTVLTVDASYPVSVLGVTLEAGGGEGPGADLLDEGLGNVAMDDDVVNGGATSPDASGLVEATNGSLSVADTTITGGGADMFGVESSGGEVAVNASTITFEGVGAAAVGAQPLTITDSTLYDNPIGVLAESSSPVIVTDSTVSDSSTAGIGILGSGPVELGGNVLANATGSVNGNCAVLGSAPVDLGYNVADDSTCGFGSADGSTVVSTSAIGLLPLASNGGATQTQQITATSAAYDIVPASATALCAAGVFDQRDVPRLQPGASDCDAGAYQVAPPTLTSITTSATDPPASVTLTGTNLQAVTGVAFGTGNTAAAVTAQTSDSLTVAVPVLTAGSQPITVTSPDGTATIGFTVAGDPTITTSSLPSAEVGQAYSETLAASAVA
jgi:hypothetical protein